MGEGSEQLTAKSVRGIVKIARGLFAPGLHLNLLPTANDRIIVGARLQEGRAYLDSDPEILFARYGLSFQEWTLVGSIGHYAASEPADDLPEATLIEGDTVVRGRTAQYINAFMNFMGDKGFTGIPQFPGFLLFPLLSIARSRKVYLLSITRLGSKSQPSDASSGGNKGQDRPARALEGSARSGTGATLGPTGHRRTADNHGLSWPIDVAGQWPYRADHAGPDRAGLASYGKGCQRTSAWFQADP
jgi:hypothetical protein